MKLPNQNIAGVMSPEERQLVNIKAEARQLDTPELIGRITRLEYQMKQSELYVHYWTGHAIISNDPRGTSLREMDIAGQHIKGIGEYGEVLVIYKTELARRPVEVSRTDIV